MQPSLAMYTYITTHTTLPRWDAMCDDAATHNLLGADSSSGHTGSHCLSHMRTCQLRLLKNESRAHGITECKYHMTENFSCMLKKRYTSAGACTMTEVHFELDNRLHVCCSNASIRDIFHSSSVPATKPSCLCIVCLRYMS